MLCLDCAQNSCDEVGNWRGRRDGVEGGREVGREVGRIHRQMECTKSDVKEEDISRHTAPITGRIEDRM